MNLQHNRIEQLCDVLKLDRISSEWPAIAQQCAREDASHSDFLERLLGLENDARIERQRAALMKTATLPSVKTIEDYDFAFASGAPRVILPPFLVVLSLGFRQRPYIGSHAS